MAAASGLDHLKNDYRARFCRPSRAPDIHRKQGQNMLEILQDCFEEKSLITDLITNSTASLVYSTPKVKDCIQSPSKECQSSLPKSAPVSCRTKAASLKGPAPDGATSTSVQVSEVHQKILANDVSCKSTPKGTPNLKTRSSEKHGSCGEVDDVCYLSVVSPAALDAKTAESQSAIPSDAPKRETCNFINSVNAQSSSSEISFKTRKRLDFGDKNILNQRQSKASEVKEKISDGQEGISPKMPQRRGQDLEYEIQPQSKKSFSTLFLETVERKNQLSPVVRHMAVAPPVSLPPSTMNLVEDEFIIDESNRSFVSQPWVTIPRKGRHLKHHEAPPAEGSTVLQDRKSQEKHHSVSPRTLTGNSDGHQAQPVARSQPSTENLGTGCALTDELENNRSTEREMYSENTKNSSGNKKTVKRKPRRTLTADIVEEQFNTGQRKDKDTSSVAQDKLQRNSERRVNDCEEMKNDPVSQRKVPSVGKKKRKNSIDKEKEESREKHLPSGSGNSFVPKEVTLTMNRSHRISRRPSDWWVVKPEGSLIDGNSSIRNELPVCQKNRQKSQKPTKKRNHLSKNARGRTVPSKRQKAATKRSSRVQKSVKAKRSRRSAFGPEEHSNSQCEPLDSDKADLAQKESLCCGAVGHCKDQDGAVSAQNINLKSQNSECATKMPTELNSNSGESKISILEASGPSRLKNYMISEKSNSGTEEEKVQEYLDNSRKKQTEVSPDRRMHPKIVFPSNTPNVRRTKRIRLKPLEYWRGERVDYQERPSGGFVIHGVLSPTPASCKRKAKRNIGKANKKVNAKSISPDNHERRDRLVLNLDIPLGDPLQPTQVKDPETSTFIPMDLIRPRDTYKFFIELDELKVYKTLDTPFFSTGKLVLGPREEKGKQYVGPDILIFYVSFGDLLCTLHETPYLITTGDSFYVPSGNYYNIRNLRNEESILLFTQIKR